jgi:folate-binding protein YgfZ
MQPDWQKFLLGHDGPAGDHRHSDRRVILTDLSHAGLIRVEGPDAVAFLQGQLSTDIERLSDDTFQLSSWNNAKGRVVTLLHVFRWGGAIYLTLPAALAPPVLKRLGMYVLRSKVTLSDVTDSLARFGLSGAGADALLNQAGAVVPTQAYAATHRDGVQVLRLYGEVPRYTVKAPVPRLIEIWEKLEGLGALPADADAWALAKLRAGEPSVFPETSEHFVAQMLDLDKLGGIDFKKGCYTGQEVIARSHYRGGVKRHLVRAECRGTAPLKPGMDIHAKGQDSPVAEIVDARRDSQDAWQMLLVIHDDARQMDLVHAASSAPVTLA